LEDYNHAVERAAIESLKHGDINGLDVFVRQFQVKAARVAYLITHDHALAEDVMQSAFIRAYDRIHQFDAGRRFEPWFMRIVVNMAIKAAGGSDARPDQQLHIAELMPDLGPDPPTVVEAQEQEEAVRRALQALTPEQRSVIVLRYYLGYTESEMARELDRPVGTIRWRLHAARRTLRGLLQWGH
jgi:RNA polymerase sigma-70 factor (ECF subfamily)